MRFAFGVSLFIVTATFAALVLAILSPIDAIAAIEDDCLAGGGSWAGPGANDGTCTYPANSAEAISNCGIDSIYTVTYNSNTEEITPACTSVASTGAGDVGGCRSEVRGPLEEAVALALCHGKNGSAAFAIGSCWIKCVISPGLPGPAARKLPGNAEAAIYVRVITPNGDASLFSYTVCFFVGDLDLRPPSIYRFVSGTWTLVAFGNENSQFICANAIEDGAFYLGEPNKKN